MALCPRRRRARRASACVWASRCSIVCGFAGLPGRSDPDPDATITLSYEEFSSAVDKLNLIGFRPSAAPKRLAALSGWRINYESSAYRLADSFTAPSRRGRAPGVIFAPRRGAKRPPHRAPAGVAKLMSADQKSSTLLARNRPARGSRRVASPMSRTRPRARVRLCADVCAVETASASSTDISDVISRGWARRIDTS